MPRAFGFLKTYPLLATTIFSTVLATWVIRSEKRWKIGGADRHGVNKSERTVFTFILSQTARKSNGERRQSFSLKSLFSERITQVASTPIRLDTFYVVVSSCERYYKSGSSSQKVSPLALSAQKESCTKKEKLSEVFGSAAQQRWVNTMIRPISVSKSYSLKVVVS
jgi:hypothetical protein